MKKREITHIGLEQLFNKIIEQPPIINEEQVTMLLHKLPNMKPGSTGQNFIQNHYNIFIVGSIVLSVVAGLLLWFGNGHPKEKNTIQNIEWKKENVPAIIDSIKELPAASIENEKALATDHPENNAQLLSGKPTPSSLPKDTMKSIANIFRHFEKKPQVYSLSQNRDTTIVGVEGTSISVKANSFISEKTVETITGNIQLEVREYYQIDDIILAGLSTTSGNELLETGGMIHITAKADGENCILKKDEVLEIGFPWSDKKDAMEMFYGEWSGDRIEWEPSIKEPLPPEEDRNVFFIVEDMPEFPGGEPALRQHIAKNMKYPAEAAKNGFQGRVYVSFIVDTAGRVTNPQIARSIHPSLDREAIRIVRSLPAWKPGRQRGKPVNVSYAVPIHFFLENAEMTNEEFESKVNDDNFHETTVTDVNRYVFSAARLGWINCDRFLRNTISSTGFSVLIDDTQNSIVNIVFHKYKTIMRGTVKSNRVTFSNVPLGEKITIVAFKVADDKIFLAVKETVITDKEETELDFQPVTKSLLKKEIEKLNKVHQ